MSGTRTHTVAAARAAVAAGLVLGVAAVYARVAGHPFTGYDDPQYLTQNERVLQGLTWDNVLWSLGTLHFANWHPLTWLSYMLDVSLFGPSPAATHLVNVGLHAASAVLLFVFLERATGARWPSALAAALFALHPTRVESVAWAAERKDVLSVLFGLLALLAYERYARRPSRRGYALVVLAFAASLASKAMLVTLPFLLLLLDVWPLRRVPILHEPVRPEPAERRARAAGPESKHEGRTVTISWRHAILEKLPLLAMSIAVSAVASVAQSRWGAVSEVPAGERLANAIVSVARYAGKLAWPVDLAFFYPLPVGGWAGWQVAGSAALVAGLTAAAVLAARRWPWVTVGWLWFLGTLVPVLGLVQLGAQSMADRYTYFPAIGLFVALALSLERVPERARVPAAALAGSALVALAGLSHRQAGLWSDEVKLFEHTLAVTGPNARAHGVLALRLRDRGDLQGAYAHIVEANRILPGSPRDLMNLGIIASEVGDVETAEHAFRSAVESGPGFAPASYALADYLRRSGRALEAVDVFRQLVRARPADGTAWNELAIQLHMTGQPAEAGQAFAEALRLAAGEYQVQRNAGIFYAQVQAWPQALQALSAADRLKPGEPDVLRRLAQVQLALGDVAGALVTAARLQQRDPGGAAAIRQAAGQR